MPRPVQPSRAPWATGAAGPAEDVRLKWRDHERAGERAIRPDELRFWLLLWLIVSATSLVGLLAIWSARSPRHWFLRTAVVGGLLCVLAVVPAWELVQIFFAQAASVAAPLVGLRLWQQGRIRFRLVDLFLLTVVAAVAVLLVKSVPEYHRHAGYWAWGAACGYAVLAGSSAVTAGWKWLKISLLTGLALAAAATGPFDWLFLWDAPRWIWYTVLPAIAAAVAACLSLLPAARAADRKRRRTARFSLAALAMALLFLPTVALIQIVFPTPIPVSHCPTPNAYTELVRIGHDLNENNPTDYELRLNAAREALRFDSLVPITYAANDAHLARHAELRALARYWIAEAHANEADGRYDDACDTYLDMTRAGAKTSRGGLLIEWALSRGILVKEGLDGLQRVREHLSPAKAPQTAVALHSLEAMLESVEAAIEREFIYAQYAYGWQARIRFLPVVEIDSETLRQADAHWRAVMQLLECHLAVRCFEHERGTLPERLDELVPTFLPSLPLDPHTGRTLIYRRRSRGFFLYSTGADQIDDGGKRAAPSAIPSPAEDLLLQDY